MKKICVVLLGAGLVAGCGDRSGTDLGRTAGTQTERGVNAGPETGVGISGQTGDRPETIPGSVDAAVDSQRQLGQAGTNVFTKVVPDPGAEPPKFRDPASNATPEDALLAQRVHVMLSLGTTATTGVISSADLNNDIQVTASASIVTLNGVVPSQPQKESFAKMALGVEGVDEVVNNLRVAPDEVKDHATQARQRGVSSGLQERR